MITLVGEVLADLFPHESVLGGAPFNVARHLQAFGLHPLMISRRGQDALGKNLLSEMTRLGMITSGIQCDSRYPTGQVKVHLEHGNHRFEILPDQAYDHIDAGIAQLAIMQIKPSLLYFGTLAQRNKPSRLAIDQMIAGSDCLKFLDINLRSPWYDKHTIRGSLARADVVKMNEDELDIVAHFFRLEGSTAEARSKALLKQFALEKLLITCGDQGAWLLDSTEEILRTGPALVVGSLVDTVGAGDAFATVFIIGLLHHWPTALTLQRANHFAAALCGIRGGAPENHDFYAAFIKAWLV
jgi:fructokinase